jgi:hypothetical protein
VDLREQTSVSEEHTASSALKMEAARPFETLVSTYKSQRSYNPGDKLCMFSVRLNDLMLSKIKGMVSLQRLPFIAPSAEMSTPKGKVPLPHSDFSNASLHE